MLSNLASFSTNHNALRSGNIRNWPIILVKEISRDHESAVVQKMSQQKSDHHGGHIGRSQFAARRCKSSEITKETLLISGIWNDI